MTILAVFRSRAQSLDYAGRLYKYGVAAQTVPAPKEANIGCGLCVKFDRSALPTRTGRLGIGEVFRLPGLLHRRLPERPRRRFSVWRTQINAREKSRL